MTWDLLFEGIMSKDGRGPCSLHKYQLFVASFKYLVMWFYKDISKSWSSTEQATLKMIKCVANGNSK